MQPGSSVIKSAAGKQQPPSRTERDEILQKIDLVASDIPRQFNTRLKSMIDAGANGAHNAGVICDHMIAELNEMNIEASTKEGKIKVLILLSKFHSHKPFEQMTKTDVFGYLNSLRKPIADDPTQRWISTYNGRQMIFLKFFKWL